MSKNVKINGTGYNGVSLVTMPTTDGGTATFKDVDEIVTPSGQLAVTENGTYDVTEYTSVNVDVETSSGNELSIDDIVMGTAPVGDMVLETATSIRNYMFTNVNIITTLNAPAVLTIGNSAFQSSSITNKLESVNIPQCTEIGQYAFAYQQALTNLILPKVTSIGNGTFSMCIGLKTVKFGSKLTSVGTHSFLGCSADIYVPNSEGEITITVPDTCTVHYDTVYDEDWNVVSST